MGADEAESIRLDPPGWPGLTDCQISRFAEAVNELLDTGIFRPALATELAAYREHAHEQMSARLQASG